MRRFLTIAAVIGLCACGLPHGSQQAGFVNHARASGGLLLTTPGKCKVWTPFAVDGEIALWSGKCGTLGFANGPGRLDLLQPDGALIARYVGSLGFGLMQGAGTWEADGERYEGMFDSGLKFGQGEEIRNGDRYVGRFHNDRKFGRGTMVWSNGDGYAGFWLNDRPDGYGRAVVGSLKVEGQWRKGCLLDSDRVVAAGQERAICEQMPPGMTVFSVDELDDLGFEELPRLSPGGCQPPKGETAPWSGYLLCH